MKKLSAILMILFKISLLSHANDDTIFYNTDWEITSKQSANYYRLSDFDPENMCFAGEVNDYFLGGDKEMTGFYRDGKRDGLFKFYFPNNQIKFEISFKNGIKYSEWTEYYPNGTG